jgi:hypothetical protein
MRTFAIEEYAELSAELADPACDRDALLAAHGLDEATFASLDGAAQEQLSRAMDTDDDGVPPLLAAYAEAFARARARLAVDAGVLPIERFGDATREISRRGDPLPTLTRLGISLADFLRANEHWTRRMLEDPALLARFRARLG